MIHVWYLIWLWFPIPDGFQKWFPRPLSPNLMCANHHMSTLSRMDGLCFPIFEPWCHFEIILISEKTEHVPRPNNPWRKITWFYGAPFWWVFSKEPFYCLLQYLGNTQDIPSKWPLKGGKCWLTNAFRGAIFSDKPKSLRVLTHHSADFQDLAWPISKG